MSKPLLPQGVRYRPASRVTYCYGAFNPVDHPQRCSRAGQAAHLKGHPTRADTMLRKF